MEYKDLRNIIHERSELNFTIASDWLQSVLFSISREDTLPLLAEIGIIPEDIVHDSSEEKLYTKVSEILLAKALKDMNYEVTILKVRSNCADIVAQSKYHGYSLVGDAKSFRLSRTAKNAKDFKVESMINWRGDSDYAVLVCPYYQYPKSNSQIYGNALVENVSLFSWEYLYIILSEKIEEKENLDLRELWNQSQIIMQQTNMADANKSFINRQDKNIQELLGVTVEKFNNSFSKIKDIIVNRGNEEIQYFESQISRIKQMNRDEAVNELLATLKIDSKIGTIRKFIDQI